MEKEFLEDRSLVYGFFSQCFSYPDNDLLGLFENGKVEEYLKGFHYLNLDTPDEIGKIVSYFKEFPAPEVTLKELQKEYTRLFINARPHVIAPPYSSIYLDGIWRVWGESTSEIIKLYTLAGVKIVDDFHDIPDHIATELEFASCLIDGQIRDGENSPTRKQSLVSIEKRFLNEHLFRWACAFFRRVIEGTKITFYKEIALLAQKFVEGEIERRKFEKVQN